MIKQKTHKKCQNPDCGKEFKLYKKTDKYCSASCSKACAKPVDLKLKPLYVIPKVSKKRAVENGKYTAQRIVFLGKPENRICPITGQQTTDIHHKKGRTGSLYLDERFWVALSREGHKFVEENPIWAKENGYSLSRIENEL